VYITTVPVSATIAPGRIVDIVFTGKDAPEPVKGLVVLNSTAKSAVLAIPLDQRERFARGVPQGFLIGATIGEMQPAAPAPATKGGKK
jgi:hypothetical protein